MLRLTKLSNVLTNAKFDFLYIIYFALTIGQQLVYPKEGYQPAVLFGQIVLAYTIRTTNEQNFPLLI